MMKSFKKKEISFVFFVLFALAGTISLSLSSHSHTSVSDIPKTSFYNHFVDRSLIDQNGHEFDPSAYFGKVVLFNFIFTQCSTVCPLQTARLADINRSFDESYQQKIEMVFISVDSQFDKPSVLKKYAQAMDADESNMHFLSASFDDIAYLQNHLHLFGNPNNPTHPEVDINLLETADKNALLNNHLALMWLVDKKGMLVQKYTASPIDTERIQRELKQVSDL